MSGFEWTALALILFGMVLPFWIMVLLVLYLAMQNKKKPSESRAPKYADLMGMFARMLDKSNDGKFDGPTMVACIRDLKKFPEYRDASIMFLEELRITGSGKFDDMAKTEQKNVERHLLGLKDD
ncbi:hypothetical protein [Aurantiacibacter sp. D1-12]|uniref:hypothetical protein n=1 Tax=Aurantiacibacter sp. D1-12 TaxID=2993658 RepID=UPI00237C9F8C|nr:hypothetical protein [Aurantiacibacter sp. D1-12]MDE1467034.1 hypothetical protein [Aurantiacibacter sp. D1-12]